MKTRYMKVLVVGLTLTLLALLVVGSIAAYPDDGAGPVAQSQSRTVASLSLFKQPKFREHMRVPREDQILRMLRAENVVPTDSTVASARTAIDEFMREWAKRNPTTPNPKKFQRLLENERRAALAGKSPKALGLAMNDQIKTLVAPVEFPGTDAFTYSADNPEYDPDVPDSPECIEVEVTTSGPLHNEIPAPGPRDNNTVWYDDATPELYNELYFASGPDAGVIVHHPNLGDVDLRGNTVANYYLEQSEGAFKPEGMVYPKWLQAAHSEGWYGADSCETGSHNVRARDLVQEVVDLINADDPNFPWQDFDADGDGVVDNFTIIHAGMGQEAGGGAQGDFAIWSHAASVDYQACAAGSVGCPDRDIYVQSYSMDPENYDVGVGAEEFGHAAFGLPDIYTTDYSNSVGFWAIMSGGSWNGPLGGMQPAPFPSWFRYVVGWWDPVVVDYEESVVEATVGQLSQRPEGTEYGIKINLPPEEEAVPNLAGDGKGWHTDIPNLSFAYAWRFFDLSQATAPVIFGFDTWFFIEELWDYGFFEVSTDGGATWTPIPDMGGLTTDQNPNDVPGWRGCCGLTGQYEGVVRYDLSDYAGMDSVGVRFTYATDWGYQDPGWWVDNLSLSDASGTIYSNDLEDFSDWTLDGWVEVPFTQLHSRYYLVEWRNYSGFDEGLQYAYQTVWSDEDEWEVDRTPYAVPGALLWFRNTAYDFDYTLGDSWWDSPSPGPKHALLVMDSHPFPYMWDGIQYSTGQNVRLGGRNQALDAAFTLGDIPEFTVRRGYTWVDGNLDYVPDIQETKTFESRPAVGVFHDYLGYYPGFWCCTADGYLVWWDIDASAVVPAKGDYSVKITDPGNNPFLPLYDYTVAGYPLGDGNPWEQAFGVNLTVLDQAEDGSWGHVQVSVQEPQVTEVAIVAAPSATGNVVSTKVLENNFGGAPLYTGSDTRGRRPVTYHGAFQFDLSAIPADAHIISAQVELTGLTDRFLGTMVNGTWAVRLLDDTVDATWTSLGYWHISRADSLAKIGPTLTEDDLGVGTVNTFAFSPYELTLLADRVATTGKASFRMDSTVDRANRRHIFGWDGGRGATGTGSAPVLRVTYMAPQ